MPDGSKARREPGEKVCTRKISAESAEDERRLRSQQIVTASANWQTRDRVKRGVSEVGDPNEKWPLASCSGVSSNSLGAQVVFRVQRKLVGRKLVGRKLVERSSWKEARGKKLVKVK